MNTGYNAWKRL